MRNYFLLIILFLFVVFPHTVFASSAYVLPYPSAMPGSVWYKLDLVKEKLQKYWFFGDFGQFDFNLAQSDKYLVEAKTLFEYKQYLLGYNALLKSDDYYKKVWPALLSASSSNKNINEKKSILSSASEKHIEELIKLKNTLPSEFVWTPEKNSPTNLNLEKEINHSIKTRSLQ